MKVQGITYAAVLADWYFGTDKLPHRLYDTCHNDDVVGCNAVCGGC